MEATLLSYILYLSRTGAIEEHAVLLSSHSWSVHEVWLQAFHVCFFVAVLPALAHTCTSQKLVVHICKMGIIVVLACSLSSAYLLLCPISKNSYSTTAKWNCLYKHKDISTPVDTNKEGLLRL